MTLTTHALGGAAVAVALHAHPGLGMCAAFGSHFLLDAIPHWDHPLRSRIEDPKNSMNDRLVFWNGAFWKDVMASSADGILGLATVGIAAATIHPEYFFLAIAGAILGILPDALQVLYYVAPHSPIRALQRFHRALHAKTDFNDRPWIGVPLQVIIIILLLGIIAAV